MRLSWHGRFRKYGLLLREVRRDEFFGVRLLVDRQIGDAIDELAGFDALDATDDSGLFELPWIEIAIVACDAITFRFVGDLYAH